MQKRIAILGGVGLIGTHLAMRLVRQGHEVYTIDVRERCASPLLRDLKAENFHYVRHNITTPFSIRCDQIYNLTAPTRLNYDRQLPAETLKGYLMGAFNTLEQARSEFSRVVMGSTAGVYATNQKLELDTRNEEVATDEGARSAEMIHRAYFVEYGVDCRIARIFNTYGPGCSIKSRRVVMRMITAALQNQPLTIFGSGEQQRTLCWVEDVVEGLMALMEASAEGAPRTVDLGSDCEITIRALAERILALTGSRSEIHHIEARFGDVRYRRPDLKVAHNRLDWHPSTSLDEGLKRTIAYVEQQLSAYRGSIRSWVEICG